jgi:hypothetical protein
MIFIDQMKNLKIYKKPMFLPTSGEYDKKKKSAIFLLTPNFQSSKDLINSPMTINRQRFQSYYLERDVSYFMSGKLKKADLEESYVRELPDQEIYQSLLEITAKEREQLKDSDFGIPSKRKYPLTTQDQIRDAIRYFDYCKKEDEKELAENINKALKKNKMSVTIGKNNRFYKYYNTTVKEAGFENPNIDQPEDTSEAAAKYVQDYIKQNIDEIYTKYFTYYIPKQVTADRFYICSVDLSSEDDKDDIIETVSGILQKINNNWKSKPITVDMLIDDTNKSAIVIGDKRVIETSECAAPIIGSPKTPELYYNAVIKVNDKILVLCHDNTYSLPEMKIDSDDIDGSINVFKDYLNSLLNIKIEDMEEYDTYSYITADNSEYRYRRTVVFMVNTYEGELKYYTDMEQFSIEYLTDFSYNHHLSDGLQQFINGWQEDHSNLDTVLEDSLGAFILFSGYDKDVLFMKKIVTPEFYHNIISIFGFKVLKIEDIPVISIVASPSSNEDNYQCSYGDREGHLEVNINLPTYDGSESIDDYCTKIWSALTSAILEGKFPAMRDTYLTRILVDYVYDIDSIYSGWGREIFDSSEISIRDYINACEKGDCRLIFNLIYKREAIRITDLYMGDFGSMEEGAASPITMDNLNKRFKYLSTSKIKHRFTKSTGGIKRLLKKIKKNLGSISTTPANIGTFNTSSSSTSTDNGGEQPVQEATVMQEMSPEEYLTMGDMVLFFNETARVSSSYNSQLRSLLYTERIMQRGDLVKMYKQVKLEIPTMLYAYPDLEMYRQRNLFVDLYYYNELFFKNNLWAGKKGFELYLTLLERLIEDPRIKAAGYTKKTVFIPVNDWNFKRSTKMWIYRENINPISIIYELMRVESPRLLKLFKDTQIVFFSNDKIFKLDFSQMDDIKKNLFIFKNFIAKINMNAEFDDDDIDTSLDNVESPRAIKANLIDKIEASKGVDLTGKEVIADKDQKEIDTARDKSIKAVNSLTKQAQKESRSNNDKISKSMENKLNAAEKNVRAVPAIDVLRTTVADRQSTVSKIVEKDLKDKVLSKDTDLSSIKQKEKDLATIATSIDAISKFATDTDGAMNLIDKDTDLKSLIIDLDTMKDNSVKIDATRAARMNNLDQKFLDTDVHGKSIKEILATDNSKEDKENTLEKTTLNIASPNPEWKNLQYMNFDKDYDLTKDILAAFYHFTKVSKPVAIRNIKVEDNSTSEDRLDLYTVEMEDFRGKRFTIKLDIPKPKDNRFLLRGNNKSIKTQFFNMPILKTDLDTCQVISNYQKIFIRRYNTTTGRSYPVASRILKAVNKYKGTDIKFTLGDNSKVCNKYELPIDYIDLATNLNTIETKNIIVYFNQDEFRQKYANIDDSYGVPYGVNKENNTILYYTIPKEDDYPFSLALYWTILATDDDFVKVFNSVTDSRGGTFSMCKVLGAMIPLVIVTAYCEGLSKVLKKAGIEYKLTEKIPADIKHDNLQWDYIKFNDGYLCYISSYTSCMLLNGLKESNTEDYSITDIDNRNMYIEFIDNYGGRIKTDGLDNFYDCFVDPITEENLKYYKLPTDFVSILLYANALLADNKFVRHSDTTSRRIRRSEMVAAYTYEVLSLAYGQYANMIKHNKSSATISVKQSAVIDKLMTSPITGDDSVITALNDVETTNAITFKGKAGLNSARAYSLDKRNYDSSMLNVMGLSTNFSGDVGITRQATMDMNIQGPRGYVKSIEGDTDKLNAAKTLCATEALTPFGSTRDDATRTNMTFVQTAKHQLRTEESDPLLVTNGADEALPYLTTDTFAFKAKSDGKIKEINDNMIIVQYDNGQRDYVNLAEAIEKNSDGGFYVPIKLVAMKGLREGSKIKQNQILAYDPKSFSNSVGESNNIAYDIGKLAKIAIINTDDGYEDAGICTEGLGKKLATRIIKKVDSVLGKDANVLQFANVGQHVEVDDNLVIWQDPHDEEEANALIKMMGNDTDVVTELGRKTLKSDLSGTVVGVKIYRTVELSELSESLRNIVEDYERPINSLKNKLKENGIDYKDLPATYKLEPTGKLKKARDAVYIEFYLEYTDTIALGDKITYFSANKATIKGIIPQKDAPYTDFRPHEPIDAFVSETSIDKRMVVSTMIYGSLQKMLVEMDRSVKDMLGIKYDDTQA